MVLPHLGVSGHLFSEVRNKLLEPSLSPFPDLPILLPGHAKSRLKPVQLFLFGS